MSTKAIASVLLSARAELEAVAANSTATSAHVKEVLKRAASSACLGDAATQVAADSDSKAVSATATAAVCCGFLSFLLHRVYPPWAAVFSGTDKRQLLDRFFFALPPTCAPLPDVVELLAQGLATSDSTDTHQCAANLLASLLTVAPPTAPRCHRLTHAIVAQAHATATAPARWHKFVALLCALPERAANCLRRRVPPALVPAAFFAQVVDQCCEALQQVHSATATATRPWNPPDAAVVLLAKAVRIGHTAALCDAMCRRATTSSSRWPPAITVAVLHSLPISYRAKAMHRVLHCCCATSAHHADVGGALMTILGKAPHMSSMASSFEEGGLLHALFVRVLCTKAVPKAAAVGCVQYLTATSATQSQLMRMTSHFAQLWSSTAFANNTNLALHASVTAVLGALVSQLSISAIEAHLVEPLLAGVQVSDNCVLESSVPA